MNGDVCYEMKISRVSHKTPCYIFVNCKRHCPRLFLCLCSLPSVLRIAAYDIIICIVLYFLIVICTRIYKYVILGNEIWRRWPIFCLLHIENACMKATTSWWQEEIKSLFNISLTAQIQWVKIWIYNDASDAFMWLYYYLLFFEYILLVRIKHK